MDGDIIAACFGPNVKTAYAWRLPVTASLDAALALVERVLPGWDFTVKRFGMRANVEVFENNGKGYEYASGKTPALALLAALLKALIAQAKSSNTNPIELEGEE